MKVEIPLESKRTSNIVMGNLSQIIRPVYMTLLTPKQTFPRHYVNSGPSVQYYDDGFVTDYAHEIGYVQEFNQLLFGVG